jgi:hypothetical protein
MFIALMSALLLQSATPAAACTATDQNLPTALRPWTTPTAAGTTVAPGQAVTFAPTGPLVLVITEAGTYGVAIDQPAWVDVAGDGAALHSNGNSLGLACSSVRKIVDFQFQPGRYTIILSRTQTPTVRLLVFRR